jgi:hypothetical protein
VPSRLTRKHHCFRPLRACSLPRRTSEVTSQAVCAGKTWKERLASYIGLCNVYWPHSSTQTHQHEHITSPCREQTPHDNHTRIPLDTTCYTGISTLTQHTRDRHRHPAKSVMQDVPFLTYLGRRTPSDITASSFPSSLRALSPNQRYAMLLAAVPRLPSTNGITVCGRRAAFAGSQLPEMRRSRCM